MNEKKIISSAKAPKPIGPYSAGVLVNGFLFTSGQLGIDPQTGNFVEGVEAQTRQALNNLAALLEEAGTSMDNVVKTTVFLKDMNDFAKMNAIYAEFFTKDFPARSAVEVARLPKDGLVEIEAITKA